MGVVTCMYATFVHVHVDTLSEFHDSKISCILFVGASTPTLYTTRTLRRFRAQVKFNFLSSLSCFFYDHTLLFHSPTTYSTPSLTDLLSYNVTLHANCYAIVIYNYSCTPHRSTTPPPPPPVTPHHTTRL